MEVQGLPVGVDSLLLPCKLWGLYSGKQIVGKRLVISLSKVYFVRRNKMEFNVDDSRGELPSIK